MQVIMGKFGEEEGGWCSLEMKEGMAQGCGMPQGESEVLLKVKFLLLWIMEEGSDVEDTLMRTSFPSLFALATLKDAWDFYAWEQAEDGGTRTHVS